jgi:t-SNARE complex subunit (syntaxin)
MCNSNNNNINDTVVKRSDFLRLGLDENKTRIFIVVVVIVVVVVVVSPNNPPHIMFLVWEI